jgi:pyruvate kinase
MKKVILYTQNNTRVMPIESDPVGSLGENYNAVAHAAARLAEKIEADVIVCQTASGATADAIAAERPNVPIITVTSNPRVAGQLALTYANSAFVRPYSPTYGLDLAQELKASGYLQTDKKELTIVIVSGQPNTQGGTDTIQIRKI